MFVSKAQFRRGSNQSIQVWMKMSQIKKHPFLEQPHILLIENQVTRSNIHGN
jgi:hypothetical protein